MTSVMGTKCYDAQHLIWAATVADRSAGHGPPQANHACIIAKGPKLISEAHLQSHGHIPAELQALESAGPAARGATAYLNMEPEDTESAIRSLHQAQISRVVIGTLHPHARRSGRTVAALRELGTDVHIWSAADAAMAACRKVNEPLFFFASEEEKIPFSVLKYAMTLDGKIATREGHSAWVSGPSSRGRVAELRRRSHAVVVGGNTLRLDDPRLTVRDDADDDGNGYQPTRVVVSPSFDLPMTARAWDVTVAPTVVVGKAGRVVAERRKEMERRGVEVWEMEECGPRAVMEELVRRKGFFSVLWECGGGLAGPAIEEGVIHKVFAFVAPKIVGGVGAPSPVGGVGFGKMSDALDLHDVEVEQIGRDVLVSGYLVPFPAP